MLNSWKSNVQYKFIQDVIKPKIVRLKLVLSINVKNILEILPILMLLFQLLLWITICFKALTRKYNQISLPSGIFGHTSVDHEAVEVILR